MISVDKIVRKNKRGYLAKPPPKPPPPPAGGITTGGWGRQALGSVGLQRGGGGGGGGGGGVTTGCGVTTPVLVPVPPAPPEPPPGPPPLPPPAPVAPVAVDDAVQPVAEHLTMVIARPLRPASPESARAYAISLTSGATTNNVAIAAIVSHNTNNREFFSFITNILYLFYLISYVRSK
jgi:hypothetical protein